MNESSRRKELVAAARGLLCGEIAFLPGIRRICGLSRYEPERDEYPLLLFRALESDTDAFACVDETNRHLYSREFLERQEQELAAYFEAARKDILEAAAALAAKGV